MKKTILIVHGRNFKPSATELRNIWIEAIGHGVGRDHPRKLAAFKASKKEFVYYGDISNRYLRSIGREYNMSADIRDRKNTLRALRTHRSNEFTKGRYNKLPGKNSIKEGFADALAGPLNWFGLSKTLIRSVAPDMEEYWNPDSAFGSDVRFQMVAPLRKAMDRGDKILVIAHSLGTMVAYDTLWKFSRTGEYRDYWKKKIDLWITLGSPLGDETVKDNLRGAMASRERKYPANVTRWENVAAEDDYISHDQRVKNDYKKMLRFGLVNQLRDHRIYNLAVRNGRSNPHSSVGYLVNPKVSKLIAEWV